MPVTRTRLVFPIMMELIIVNVLRDIKRTRLVFAKTSMNVKSIIGANTDAPTHLVDGRVHAQTDLLYDQTDAHVVFNATNVTMLLLMKSVTHRIDFEN